MSAVVWGGPGIPCRPPHRPLRAVTARLMEVILSDSPQVQRQTEQYISESYQHLSQAAELDWTNNDLSTSRHVGQPEGRNNYPPIITNDVASFPRRGQLLSASQRAGNDGRTMGRRWESDGASGTGETMETMKS